MPKEIVIYLNLLYSQANTGNFFRFLFILLTNSAGDVTTSDENNQME
jgi:hypothetical protein